MNTQTHWNIAKLSMGKIEELSPNYKMKGRRRLMFLLGNVQPDLSILKFVHPHFYEKSSEYIYSEIRRMEQKEKYGMLDEYHLGKLVHYLSDFCCYAHNSGREGGMTEHIGYELEINRYLNTNYSELCQKISQKELKKGKYPDVILYVEENIKQYKLAEPSYAVDIEKSIEITTALILNVLCDVKSLSFRNPFLKNEDASAILSI